MLDRIKKSDYLTLNDRFYTKVKANPLCEPSLVSANKLLANEMNIDEEFLDTKEFIELLNGERDLETFATAYSGHQFGYFVPNLGDGRALNLGQIDNRQLQLKGSGLTAYSRDGDGRAVLRSSIREYLISEAMYGLGIPTTRALGLITSKTKVYREKVEQGAIVLRVSPSWIRFGSFEYAYLGKNKVEQVKQLADFTIKHSFSHLNDKENRYEELFFEIVDRTSNMIAYWQAYGFMHGVMNTDNMSILGLTIDYGPFAFMEIFDKGFTCNLSDHESRYSFENQPYIAQWNLQVLIKVFSLIADKEKLESYNNTFIGKYKKLYFNIMFKKLGFKEELEGDKKLLSELLKAMQSDKIDYTSFFYKLNFKNYDSIDGSNIKLWLEKYKKRASKSRVDFESMKSVNPKYILRNHMLHEAIEKAQLGDYTMVNILLSIAQNPYGEHKEFEHFTKTLKEDFSLKCSCSS